MASLRPAPEAELVQALTRLWIGTKKQAALADTPLREVLAVYLDALSAIPADIALHILTTWTSTPKPKDAHHWWPAEGEILDAAREQTEDRRALRIATEAVDLPKMRRARRDLLVWSLEKIDQGRPFPEHRAEYARDRDALVASINDEIAELEAMEG